jgi:hypothetical protein
MPTASLNPWINPELVTVAPPATIFTPSPEEYWLMIVPLFVSVPPPAWTAAWAPEPVARMVFEFVTYPAPSM